MRIITRTVWILSLVSLLADIASEMLYPVIPVYLKEIGFSVLLIGILEGVVNFTPGISKGYFGKLSDEKGLRLPFVKLGYFLSAVSKPMIAFFTQISWIFIARVFGFHRSMDTVGAAIGPLVALFYLAMYPGAYKTLFMLAFVPGILSVLLIFLLKEKKQPVSTLGKGHFFSFLKYWTIASPGFKKLFRPCCSLPFITCFMLPFPIRPGCWLIRSVSVMW